MRKKGMKCICGAIADYRENLSFNGHKIAGWKCKKCKEVYYHPEQVQKILLFNKLKHRILKLKLSKVRSNKIMRIPKEIDEALGFKKEVKLELEGKSIKITPL